MLKPNKKFAFFVLVYNHEAFVIEHLESIKYLIESYGANMCFDIVINDDCSRDSSRLIIDSWLVYNHHLFRNIDRLYNSVNIGTCKSVINMIKTMRFDIDVCKLTAADDIYSFENLFEYAFKYRASSMVSGIPLHFSDGELYLDSREFYGIICSQHCYVGSDSTKRFRFLSVNNAPNIIYNKEMLASDHVVEFLSQYDVVEDWPIQIAISEFSENFNFELVNKVFVYYRRTAGSAYIVANKRFLSDKLKIFSYLISNSNNFFEKIVLINRAWLFKRGGRLSNKVLNISFYIFVFKSLLSLVRINQFKNKFSPDISVHSKHLELIRKRVEVFINNKDSSL